MTGRFTRRILPILATLVVICGLGAGVAAHSGGIPEWGDGGTGGLKAGPLGLNETPAQATAQLPVAMQIPDADVDAEVEVRSLSNGVMQDPTGPWVVSWYDFSAYVGDNSNAVFAGHVDYWGVGPAVLRNVAGLGIGAEIHVHGADGTIFTYAVEDVYRVNAYELSAADLDAIIGPTDYAALTIITCGGEFNGSEYLQRDIVRARLVETSTGEEAAAEEEATAETEAGTGELAAGGTATVIGAGINVRSEPTTASAVVTVVTTGDTVTITGESQEADGYTWWPVELADGTTGWIAGDFLQP
jgi:sortase (surface protein transpeptidase)